MLLALFVSTVAAAQNPLADLPNLVPNGGFEEGTTGWHVSIGPRSWDEARDIAEVSEDRADAGKRCLRLSAVHQDSEVDATSGVIAVEPSMAHLLLARVKQDAGEGGYKVTIDWRDADGKHLSYDNDWKGNDHPVGFADHGGVFTAPEGAAQAVIILGVSKGAECRFDEVRLSPLPGPPGEDVPDGSGRVEAELPATIEAGGYGTFRFTYHAGDQGLPTGGAVYLRRDNIDPRWSVPQTSDPGAPGYLTVTATNGALCMVQPGSASSVPCVTRIAVAYPALKPGDALTITYGDTSKGSPGAQAQTKAEPGLHFVLSVDGDRDDRPLDLPDTQAFDVVPGPFTHLAYVLPWVVEAGVPFNVAVEAHDGKGNLVSDAQGEVTVAETNAEKLASPRTARIVDGRAQLQLALSRPGLQRLSARATHGKGQPDAVLVTRSPGRPTSAVEAGARASDDQGTCVLENPHVRLLLPPNPFGYGVAFLEGRTEGAWRPVAVLSCAATIVPGSGDPPGCYAPEVSIAQAGPELARLVLHGRKVGGGAEWDVTLEYSLTADARHIGYRLRARPDHDAELLFISGPSLSVNLGDRGGSKDSALLPGLEYLTADEVSSGEYGIVEPYSERAHPDPLKVTLPLMAVDAGGICGGVFWGPREDAGLAGRGAQPAFHSPSARRGSGWDGHGLGLVTPPTPDSSITGPGAAAEWVAIPAGQTLSLEASLVALAPATDVTDMVRYWFEANGVPDLPPAPRSPDEGAELTVRGLLETAWDAEKRGWHSALNDPWGAAYNDQVALRLWHYAKAHPASPLTPRIDAELAQAFDAAGGMHGYSFAFHTGDPAEAWEAERAAGLRDALAMAADGSYAYHPHTGSKQFTQAQAKSLGRDGEVNIGTCVMGLEPLMRRALVTGDPFLIAQGEKGLAFIDRFSRPQGAENWEVPLACPNLRASALALRCYLYGYLLTGKEHYLEKARFWATTGLPFIYAWNADDRPIMRYASISVMGTTLHTHGWFGKPVQWVGLVYADALLELAAHDDSFPWRKVAEGILTCATQMQKTEADPCGHVGFYPDAYDVVTGKEAYHWCLAPTLIAQVSAALTGPDPKVSTTVLRAGERRLHLTGPGSLADAALDGDTLRFAADYLPGSDYRLLVSPLAAVETVVVDGSPLTAGEWQVVPPGLLRIHVRQAGAGARIEVRGCRFAELAAPIGAEGIANGGFEQGLGGWAPSDPEAARASDDAHGGKTALLLDARGRTQEVQCPSAPMPVEEGKAYELVSWVKQTAGEGKYKVTIDWLGAGGHLRYDNDWLGTDHPAAYVQHGGRFIAPPDAKAAVIILGVQPGTSCLFDDVTLTAVR